MTDRRFMTALANAWQGILIAMRNEPNMKRQMVLFAVALLLAIVLQCSQVEFMILLLTGGLVIGCELLNSALEGFEDLIHPDHHPLIQQSKDIAAGAVLFVSMISVVIGLFIFIPRILSFF